MYPFFTTPEQHEYREGDLLFIIFIKHFPLMCSLTCLGYLVRNQCICTFYELLQRFSRSGLFSNSEYINSF